MKDFEKEIMKIHPQMKFRGWEVRFLLRWAYRVGRNQKMSCKLGSIEKVEKSYKYEAHKALERKAMNIVRNKITKN